MPTKKPEPTLLEQLSDQAVSEAGADIFHAAYSPFLSIVRLGQTPYDRTPLH